MCSFERNKGNCRVYEVPEARILKQLQRIVFSPEFSILLSWEAAFSIMFSYNVGKVAGGSGV